MKQNLKKASALLLFNISILVAFGQTCFTMTKDKGNFYISTVVNGQDSTRLFVESGLPGILINEHDYCRLFIDSLYQTVDSGCSEIKYYRGSHKVYKIKYGKVHIGDLSYQGNIYVIDKYDKIGVPIHILKNEKDSTANFACFDFKHNTLNYVGQNAIDGKKIHKYKMVEVSPMPVVETTLFIRDTYGHSGSIQGKFIFDIGNSSPLFLFAKNQSITNFIKGKHFKILPAKDNQGNNIGYGIYAGYCEVGKRTNRNVSIGMTDKICINDFLGCIGPSLFGNGRVTIDTINNAIYYE